MEAVVAYLEAGLIYHFS